MLAMLLAARDVVSFTRGMSFDDFGGTAECSYRSSSR